MYVCVEKMLVEWQARSQSIDAGIKKQMDDLENTVQGMYVYMYVCMSLQSRYVCVCVYMYVCMCVCMYVCMSSQSRYVCVYVCRKDACGMAG